MQLIGSIPDIEPLLVLGSIPEAAAREADSRLLLDRAKGTDQTDGAWADQALRGEPDTLDFGYIGPDGFAVPGGIWTWDHGSTDPLEGWYSTDLSGQSTAYFRHISEGVWTTGTGNLGSAPILNGLGSLWVGAFESEGDALCWSGGLGYGNRWCQRALSPVLGYSGIGNVNIALTYFNDSEEDFDYSSVILRLLPSGNEVELDSFTGAVGLASTHPADPPPGASFSDVLVGPGFQGATQFQIVFEFASDGGWSDEDGIFDTAYGPFGADDVRLTGSIVGGPRTFAFETDLDGWTAEACEPVGSFLGVASFASYLTEEACGCDIAGNVLELHDAGFGHPVGQHELLRSNPVDVLNDLPPTPDERRLFAVEFDQYSNMPRANGVFYRPGWEYYPFTCPSSGTVTWSGRVGEENFSYVGNEPVCGTHRTGERTSQIPGSGIEQVRFLYELYASCDAFGIPPDICTSVTNFTPLVDNVRIRCTTAPAAPPIAFANGTRYQDGCVTADFFDPNGVGRADVTRNVNLGNNPPFVLGDSLFVIGPTATATTQWESRLWFRITRQGVGRTPAQYNSWKNAVSDGRDITAGEFTFAWMDSFQLGTQTAKNKFVSYFRETGEDDYNSGAGELNTCSRRAFTGAS